MIVTAGIAMFVVYFSPKGYAGMYVTKAWFILDGHLQPGRPQPNFTLKEARAMVPEGCVNLGRCGPDDEAVFETWI